MEENCILLGGKNPNCVMRCEDKTQFWGPNSIALATGVCSYANAYGDCRWDDVSSCAGYHFDSSPLSGPVTVFVHEGQMPDIPGKGVSGIDISVCAYSSTECTETQTTDPNGFATFQRASGGFTAPYFEISLESPALQLKPPWPNGPKKLLVNAGRALVPGSLVSIPIGAEPLSQQWVPGKAALLAYPRGCYPGVIIAASTDLDSGADGLKGGGVDGGTPNVTSWEFEAIEPGMRTVTASVGGKPFAGALVMTKPDAFTLVPFLFPTAQALGSK